MDTEENNVPTPDELQEEQESLAEVKDDDLRSSVVDSLGLEDNDDNQDLIEKVIEREKSHRQKLSGAIGSKIKWREKAQSSPEPGQKKEDPKGDNLDADSLRKQTEETVRAQFDEEYLEDTDYSDNLKAEMRKVAKLNETSVRAATKDPYIQHLIENETKESRAAEAANNGNGEKKGAQDGSEGMPSKFNDPTYMSTEEGQKEFDEWLASQK